MDYTSEIFNEALTIIEDACFLVSGKKCNQWGLTLTLKYADHANVGGICKTIQYTSLIFNRSIRDLWTLIACIYNIYDVKKKQHAIFAKSGLNS